MPERARDRLTFSGPRPPEELMAQVDALPPIEDIARQLRQQWPLLREHGARELAQHLWWQLLAETYETYGIEWAEPARQEAQL